MEVRVVSAHGLLFEGKATFVVACGLKGEVGIKPRHAPMLMQLRPGTVTVSLEDQTQEVFYVSGGVLEAQPNMVLILSDLGSRAKDIDERQAQEVRQRAQKMLADHVGKVEHAKLVQELALSLAQLQALRKYRKQLENRRS